MRHALSWAAAVSVIVCTCRPAEAQDAEARAKALFDEGTQRLDHNDLAGALRRYRAAYELVPRAMILRNIGAILSELDRPADAANAFAQYLARPDSEPEWSPKIAGALAALDAKLGRVHLIVDVEGATARLDGVALGVTPIDRVIRVEPGKHVIAIRRSDDPSADGTTIDVSGVAGRETTVRLDEADLWPTRSMTPARRATAGSASRVSAGAPAPVGVDVGIAVFARADIDLRGRGAVAAPGAMVRIGRHIDLFANALVGANSGAELGARLGWQWRWLRPLASLSAPMFVVDGLHPNLRVGVGGEWIGLAPLRIGVELGVAHALSRPDGVVANVFVGSVTVAVDIR
jgi:hypothetical protein